ncbi:MAG: YaeQ family protein [Gemmatimonadaceae bacterium]|nr:YaeQ family protein [Gemmatimonadaceae bacterium]
MALSSTLFTVDVTLSDVDRSVYESFVIKAACHPSESAEYLVTRLLAYCLEYTDGIAFSKGGVSDPDDPPLVVRDLTGAWVSWIEIGAPDAARLHKASKASPRVAVYTHREPRTVLRAWEGARIHRAEAIEVHAVDRDLIDALAARLDRRTTWAVTVTERELWVTIGDETLTGAVTRLAVPTS